MVIFLMLLNLVLFCGVIVVGRFLIKEHGSKYFKYIDIFNLFFFNWFCLFNLSEHIILIHRNPSTQQWLYVFLNLVFRSFAYSCSRWTPSVPGVCEHGLACPDPRADGRELFWVLGDSFLSPHQLCREVYVCSVSLVSNTSYLDWLYIRLYIYICIHKNAYIFIKGFNISIYSGWLLVYCTAVAASSEAWTTNFTLPSVSSALT